MDKVKSYRKVILPRTRLAGRDIQSRLLVAKSGMFARNCVLSGKCWEERTFPLYAKVKPVITNYPIGEEYLGRISSASGNALNVMPSNKPGITSTAYCALAAPNDWIQYSHTARPVTVDGYEFITHGDYSPRKWEFQGSYDGVNWTTLDSVVRVDSWTPGVLNTYSGTVVPENRGAYTMHRLVVTDFDAATCRIYHFQFFDADVDNAQSIYLDADAAHPLQIAFADGFDEDGLAKSVVKTITTGTSLDFSADLPLLDALNNQFLNQFYGGSAKFYAVYDAAGDILSYELEPIYQGQIFPTYVVPSLDSDTGNAGNPASIFDPLIDGLWGVQNSGETKSATFSYATPLFTDSFSISFRFYTSSSTYYLSVDLSEDGVNYDTYAKYSGSSKTGYTEVGSGTKTMEILLPRVYSLQRVRLYVTKSSTTNSSYYTHIYHLRFNDITKNPDRRLYQGKTYYYDIVSEEWVHEYRVPLGMVHIGRNVDDTAWVISSFTPTHIPQMVTVPWFRNTSHFD